MVNKIVVRGIGVPNYSMIERDHSMHIYYVYAYLRKDGTPYYIGKGKGRRAWDKDHKVKVPPKERIVFVEMMALGYGSTHKNRDRSPYSELVRLISLLIQGLTPCIQQRLVRGLACQCGIR